MAYTVYALSDPNTEHVHYVGITKDIHKRYAQHLLFNQNEAKDTWLAVLKKSGLFPVLVILESDVDKTLIYERELYWISHYLNLGMPLANRVITKRAQLAQTKVKKPLLPDRWISGLEAAAILTEHTDHEVGADYVRLLARDGKIAYRPRDGRTNEYSLKDVLSYRVRPQGTPRIRPRPSTRKEKVIEEAVA